jgi:hypothetical protein
MSKLGGKLLRMFPIQARAMLENARGCSLESDFGCERSHRTLPGCTSYIPVQHMPGLLRYTVNSTSNYTLWTLYRSYYKELLQRVLERRTRIGKRSAGRPQARWSDDLRRTADRSWMRVAEDRARWREIREAYVQQCTVVG